MKNIWYAKISEMMNDLRAYKGTFAIMTQEIVDAVVPHVYRSQKCFIRKKWAKDQWFTAIKTSVT